MYWTYFGGGIIRRAEMDGSGSAIFLSGLGNPRGITIDFDSSKLYWVEKADGKIQSSDFEGKEIRTVLTLSANYTQTSIRRTLE